jgi:ubiquinone/menaquinone biosynthesis C-methylase UbiE
MLDLTALADATRAAVGAGHRVFQIHRFAETEAAHLARLERWAELPDEARVIDMGSGVGEVAKRFRCIRPDLSFTLVNISAAQLEYSPEFPSYCGDFCAVPEPNNSFDAALFCFSIGYADRDAALAEASRLLRPGGVLFIYDMVRVSGDNQGMQEVSYTVDPRADIDQAALQAGFVSDLYLEPADRGNYGKTVLGSQFDAIFHGTIPAIWRLVKPLRHLVVREGGTT